MSKIRTLTQLQQRLDDDFGWRLKELSDISAAAKRCPGLAQATIVRAGVALLYAHWEGWIKGASQSYLEYISTQGLRYYELNNYIVVLGLKKRLREITGSNRMTLNLTALDFIRDEMGERARFDPEACIQTKSNLDAGVFSEIARTVGVELGEYEPRFQLIDRELVKRRNSIAHGDYLAIDVPSWTALFGEVLGMMRSYKTDIENLASLQKHRRRSSEGGAA